MSHGPHLGIAWHCELLKLTTNYSGKDVAMDATTTATDDSPHLYGQYWNVINSISERGLNGQLLAALLVGGGLIFMLYGFRLFRVLITINFGAAGGYLGFLLGERFGSALVGAGIGAVVFALVAWPMMRYAVALAGGAIGAYVGALAWEQLTLPADLLWLGGLVGLITLGLLAFITLKPSVMAATAIQGSAMVVTGTLVLLSNQGDLDVKFHEAMNPSEKPLLFLMLMLLPAAIGVVYQYNREGIRYGPGSQIDRAVEAFKSVLEIAPKHASAYNNLGAAYLQKRRYVEARQAWEQALDADPNHPSARANLTMLRRMGF